MTGKVPKKEDHVTELLSESVLSFGFLDPWSWDW